jgi:hypothetical protein
VNAPTPGLEYTRISEDAAILCRRHDFPRAMNVLQRRLPDHRRWRHALRGIAHHSVNALDGARLTWMSGAIRDLLFGSVDSPWLRNEIAVDLHAVAGGFAADGILPEWTARSLWRTADDAGIPMAYIAQVTPLPRAIDDALDTAQVVTDFRRTALAHRQCALELAQTVPTRVMTDALPCDEMLVQLQIESQRDAAARWRALAQSVLLGG